MFYKVKAKDYIRVPPHMFNLPQQQAILQNVKSTYENFISKDLGVVIGVTSINEVGEGVIIPGDGAAYYETVFTLLTFKPELQEVVVGTVREINEFGAFLDIGPLDGMVHISELAPFRVERVSDIIKEGMIVPVKVIKVDEERGKISLSIKEADKNFFKKS